MMVLVLTAHVQLVATLQICGSDPHVSGAAADEGGLVAEHCGTAQCVLPAVGCMAAFGEKFELSRFFSNDHRFHPLTTEIFRLFSSNFI
jgi:hypothetical protein